MMPSYQHKAFIVPEPTHCFVVLCLQSFLEKSSFHISLPIIQTIDMAHLKMTTIDSQLYRHLRRYGSARGATLETIT